MAKNGILLGTLAFALSVLAAVASIGPAFGETRRKDDVQEGGAQIAPCVGGVWMSGDGQIRHELFANGRFVEAHETLETVYEGQYRIIGDKIEYSDDTGLTTEGIFKDGILYQSGLVLYRRDQPLV